MKIMIVEDHALMREVLADIITFSQGDRVQILNCKSGEEAIVQYPEFKPDMVFMDIDLKTMSGFKVTEKIIEEYGASNVVFVTSYDTPTFRRKAKHLDALAFICKDNLSDLNPILQNINTK